MTRKNLTHSSELHLNVILSLISIMGVERKRLKLFGLKKKLNFDLGVYGCRLPSADWHICYINQILNNTIFWGTVGYLVAVYLIHSELQQQWCDGYNVASLCSSFRSSACRLLVTPHPRRPSRGALHPPLRSVSESLVSWRGCWSMLWRPCICQDTSCHLLAVPESGSHQTSESLWWWWRFSVFDDI